MTTIRLPAPLRPYAGGAAEVPVSGATVSAALDNLISVHPSLRPHLLDSSGQLRPFVNLFLGEDNINDIEGLNTTLHAGDRLLLVPSIAGGKG